MHLVYPPAPTQNFALPFSSISLGTSVIPRRNWKQSLCKFGGRGVNKMYYGLCENCEWMENVKIDSNIYPSFSIAFFFNRLSRFCQETESHSRTHAPPSPLPNKSSSYGRYIRSINSSQQGRLISKQNIISQLAAMQHKLFNSNTGVLFFCHFPL